MTVGNRIKMMREDLHLTQEQVANAVGVAIQTIHKYENNIVTNIPLDKLEKLAAALGTSPSYLMGWERGKGAKEISLNFNNIFKLDIKKYPLLGDIACGKPIYTNEDRESYIMSGTEIKADFCLKCVGDSMIGARIFDGDIVFIREQPIVENGEIAAVVIGDEATLKRWYYYPEEEKLILNAENPKYPPLVYIGSELEAVHCLGKAVVFQSDVV